MIIVIYQVQGHWVIRAYDRAFWTQNGADIRCETLAEAAETVDMLTNTNEITAAVNNLPVLNREDSVTVRIVQDKRSAA